MSAKLDRSVEETIAIVRNVREWRNKHYNDPRVRFDKTPEEISWREEMNRRRLQSRRNWDFNHGRIVSVADAWPK